MIKSILSEKVEFTNNRQLKQFIMAMKTYKNYHKAFDDCLTVVVSLSVHLVTIQELSTHTNNI